MDDCLRLAVAPARRLDHAVWLRPVELLMLAQFASRDDQGPVRTDAAANVVLGPGTRRPIGRANLRARVRRQRVLVAIDGISGHDTTPTSSAAISGNFSVDLPLGRKSSIAVH